MTTYNVYAGKTLSVDLHAGDEMFVHHGTSFDTTVGAGALEVVSGGGVVNGNVVESGGMLRLSSSAFASGDTVESGGTLLVQSAISAGQTYNYSGARVSATTSYVRANQSLTLDSGAFLQNDLTISSGAIVSVIGGAALQAATVLSGGVLSGPGALAGIAPDYGLVEGVLLERGARLLVESGAVADGITVSVGAVLSGAGGVISGAVVQNGGEIVQGPGVLSDAIVSNGGSAVLTGLSSGQSLILASGGDVTSTTALDGLVLKSGAVARFSAYADIHSGATLSVLAGAELGSLVVDSGGAVIGSGLFEAAINASGLVRNMSIGSFAQLRVYGGGVADGVHAIGGQVYLLSGGVASGDMLVQGGQTVSSGGVSSDTLVFAGGSQTVLKGGVAFNDRLVGGIEIVSSGGAVSGLGLPLGVLYDYGLVRLGGVQTWHGAISGNGKLAVAGIGHLTLSGTATGFSGLAIISGGTIEAASHKALGAAQVVFASPAVSATLQIDAADAPAPGDAFMNTLSNFDRTNDFVDLRSIAFAPGATAVVSGSQLVISNGADTYALNLQGRVAGGYAVSADGHGGTLINPQATGFAHAVAGFGGKGGVLTPVSGQPGGRFEPVVTAAGSAGR